MKPDVGWLLMMIALWLYGLWPTLYPDHFRRTGVRYQKIPMLNSLTPPAEVIRVLGWIYTLLFGGAIVMVLVRYLTK